MCSTGIFHTFDCDCSESFSSSSLLSVSITGSSIFDLAARDLGVAATRSPPLPLGVDVLGLNKHTKRCYLYFIFI